MRIVRRVRADVAVLSLATLGAAACVDTFEGSSVQIDLARAIQTNPRGTEVRDPDQPDLNTHYVLYATDAVYKLGADGLPLLDSNGEPLIDRSYLFEVQQFQIRPVVDLSSPCFIDIEDTRFPGLHGTQYAAALRAAVGIPDPYAANCAATDEVCKGNVIDILTADRRIAVQPMLQSALKAVTSFTNFRYPSVGTDCPGTEPQVIPPPTCTDAASNAKRLALCEALWAANPDWYEGSDKVFTLPLSGKFFGMVDGMNPINSGFVGGASFIVPDNLVGLDSYSMNWQYDDLDHDGQPDFPATLPADQRSTTGYVYLQGAPKAFVRGVIKVPMAHPSNNRLSGTLAIFPDLGTDSVDF